MAKLRKIVDWKNTYGNAYREMMRNVLEKHGFEWGLMNALRLIYENGEVYGKVYGGISDWFHVEQGVRRGCEIALWLF